MIQKPRLVSALVLCLQALPGFGLAACSKTPSSAATSTQAAAPIVTGTSAGSTSQPLSPAALAASSGYSCSFPGPDGRSILARFTLDGPGAHDDQGLPFTVLANSPTALVLAHPRDDLAVAPNGDAGAYVVAIDRRSLAMVQTTVGLNGPGGTRRGHCIAG